MTIGAWLKQTERSLDAAGIGSARLDAEVILAYGLGRNRTWLAAHSDEELSDSQAIAANKLAQRRAGRTPLVHLTGQKDFYSLDLIITPDVLTPRAETETMVEQVIAAAPAGANLLDVGTGSGAIAIAVAKHRPDLKVTATDISPAALKIAEQNSRKHNSKMTLIKSDLLSKVSGRFDIITANLPYLTNDAELMPEVAKEPGVALLGGHDGLELYRRFFSELPGHLAAGGLVLTESDPWQHHKIIGLAKAAKLELWSENYFILGFINQN